MKARFLVSGALALLPLAMFADADVKGVVVNKTTGQPMDFVNVQLVDATTGKGLPIGTQTDESGVFILSNVKTGKYVLKVSNLGSVDLERDLKVESTPIDLGTLRLTDDSKMLQEVVVEGVRSQMRFELDKKVFTVDANIAAAGQSASELLESIPSVEVDQDGEVSLRGNSSVTIWINGKDSGLTADNRAQILEQIPGDTIEKIEVITNPSAKYSPEGTAGIINIVLKKDRKAGYFGSAEIGANSRGGGNASVNFNYSSSKWDAYGSVGFRMRHNKGGSEMRRKYEDGTFINSDAVSPHHRNNLFLRAGATYHLTDKDNFYLNSFGMFGHRWGYSRTNYESNVPAQWNINRELSRNGGDNRAAHVEWGYTHKWSDNHSIDAMVAYNFWGGPSWDTYQEQQIWNGTETEPEREEMSFRRQEMPIHSNVWEAKVDYTKQLTSWLKLEAGFAGNYSHENTPNTSWTGPDKENVTLAEGLYNRFIYTNNVSALYFTLGGKIKNFSFSAGLRSEAWQVRAYSLKYGEARSDNNLFKSNKFGLFPSVFLSYSLPYDNEVQINYTRRIRRPWGGQLNSFLDTSDPVNYSYGNTELEPQYSNSFELNYLKSFTWHIISLSAYIRTSDNMINRISYLNPYDNIIYSTPVNVANEVNSGVEIVSKNNIVHNVFDLTTTINLYNNHIGAWDYKGIAYNPDGTSTEIKEFTLPYTEAQNTFAWDARMMANVKLPWGMSFQATGRYNSGRKTAQGSRDGGWSVDAGLRKIAGNWSFSLNCRDIFDSRKRKSTTIIPDSFVQNNKRWRGGRTLQLTIKYSFGNMKGDNKNRNNSGEPAMSGGYGEEM